MEVIKLIELQIRQIAHKCKIDESDVKVALSEWQNHFGENSPFGSPFANPIKECALFCSFCYYKQQKEQDVSIASFLAEYIWAFKNRFTKNSDSVKKESDTAKPSPMNKGREIERTVYDLPKMRDSCFGVPSYYNSDFVGARLFNPISAKQQSNESNNLV